MGVAIDTKTLGRRLITSKTAKGQKRLYGKSIFSGIFDSFATFIFFPASGKKE